MSNKYNFVWFHVFLYIRYHQILHIRLITHTYSCYIIFW